MVVCVDLVVYVFFGVVEFWVDVVEYVGDLMGDEFFDVLVGVVVV